MPAAVVLFRLTASHHSTKSTSNLQEISLPVDVRERFNEFRNLPALVWIPDASVRERELHSLRIKLSDQTHCIGRDCCCGSGVTN